MTETDHQLLEAAAKAAGIEFGVIHQRPHRRCPEGWTPWNPLTDDGDAMRLTVARRVDVWFLGQNAVQAARAGQPTTTEAICIETDPNAATRRAIVRAAAALAA